MAFDIEYANKQIDFIQDEYVELYKLYRLTKEQNNQENRGNLQGKWNIVNNSISEYIRYLWYKGVNPNESYITKWIKDHDVWEILDEIEDFLHPAEEE